MGFLLGLDFFDTNHSEEKPCVHLYHFMKLGTTEFAIVQFAINIQVSIFSIHS
jgi:hypothetical protein